MSAQVGRADLLRALRLGREGALALEHTETTWWGYARPEQPRSTIEPLVLNLPPAELVTGTNVEVPEAAAALKARSPLRMPEAWVAERITSGHGREEPEGTSALESRPPLRPEDLQPPDMPAVRYQDLVPLPRLVKPLYLQLRQARPGVVDLPALLRASARRRWPRTMPRSARQVWPQTLVLLLDVSTELFPYRRDMYRVAGLLRACVPKVQLQVRIGFDGLHGSWTPWPDDIAMPEGEGHLQPESGHSYLILSDLGLLRRASHVHLSWRVWLAEAQRKHCDCVALAPVAADDVDAGLANLIRVLRWSPDSRWTPERGPARGTQEAQDEPQALRELLGCLAATLRMDPPLLRALRQYSSAAQDASLEGRLWSHPDVRATSYATLRHDALSPRPHEAVTPNRSLLSALHKQAVDHHAHWPMGMRLVERIRQLMSEARISSSSWQETRSDLHRLAQSLLQISSGHDALTATADYVLRSMPDEAKPYLGSAIDALAQARGRLMGARRTWCLMQRGEQLLVMQAFDVIRSDVGIVLCSDLGVAAPGEILLITSPGQRPRYLRLPAKGFLVLPNMQHGALVVLGGRQTCLRRQIRTRGLLGWQQTDQGLLEHFDLPWLRELSFPVDGGGGVAALLPDASGNDIAVRIDRDKYGVFLVIRPHVLAQEGREWDEYIRFRYMEPGTFFQGSQKSVGGNDEYPRHQVTLTQGLWLSETPCTQALWQAVMGRNPSHFWQGPHASRRPVDSVSWNDVQVFLKKIQTMFPVGCNAVLPTESQWEYACRAGSQTDYWWGDGFHADKANVDINGRRQSNNEGTTSVDLYPPNPWGFYDMHGNVWEWCSDGDRSYTYKPELNPVGRSDVFSRVVRGGSWSDSPNCARATFRLTRLCGFAFHHLGFRFALMCSPVAEIKAGGATKAVARKRKQKMR